MLDFYFVGCIIDYEALKEISRYLNPRGRKAMLHGPPATVTVVHISLQNGLADAAKLEDGDILPLGDGGSAIASSK